MENSGSKGDQFWHHFQIEVNAVTEVWPFG